MQTIHINSKLKCPHCGSVQEDGDIAADYVNTYDPEWQEVICEDYECGRVFLMRSGPDNTHLEVSED